MISYLLLNDCRVKNASRRLPPDGSPFGGTVRSLGQNFNAKLKQTLARPGKIAVKNAKFECLLLVEPEVIVFRSFSSGKTIT